jgi:maltooligosyltrehalose trehalohydrolase
MWMRDFHIDGLRIDAVHAFVDRSAIHFLEQLAAETETLAAALARELVLIAESDLNDPRVVTPRECGGFGMDAQWSDDFHHSLFAVLNPGPQEGYYADFGSLEQLAKAIERTFVYDGIYSSYRKRSHGRRISRLPQHRFMGFIQNHDQVGNRALGDRICGIAGFDRAKIAAALVLLGPFVPMLFQGEEWAASSPFQYFADHEPELAQLVSDGRRKEFAAFGWDPASIPDPEARATYERSKIKWSELLQSPHAEMLFWYRELIRLRRTTPSLNDGEQRHTRVSYDENRMWLCMHRESITVCCNLGRSEYSHPCGAESQVMLASRPNLSIENRVLLLPPDTVAVISKTPHFQK